MKKIFVLPEYTTAKEIKKLRKDLHLTQKDFAELINCSKPTVERWERSEEVIRGPIVPLLRMLQKYPEYSRPAVKNETDTERSGLAIL